MESIDVLPDLLYIKFTRSVVALHHKKITDSLNMRSLLFFL
ncbi:hypothetical protein Bateq7PJ16_0773 [Bacillus subtilis]|nr:hypothetical protein Bateq7PJ16_0773 [Bacillus subtilis]